jgi:GTP-binding protein Era
MELKNNYQAGFVTIIGKPNVGKSTLMNQLVGERLSIITPKAQTTRHSICGIVHNENFQVIFTDTPGILQPAYMLQQRMMHAVEREILATDVFLWMVDAIAEQEIPPIIQKLLVNNTRPILLIINKIDLLSQPNAIQALIEHWEKKIAVTKIVPIAALHGLKTSHLLEEIVSYLPQHPPYYPPDILTDKSERFLAAEILREKIFENYQQEIPYAVEVIIDEFQETDSLLRLSAIIYVERKSQKAIIIGKNGEALKHVGTAARKALEQFFCKKIFLQQHVKVLADWRNEAKILHRLGYE